MFVSVYINIFNYICEQRAMSPAHCTMHFLAQGRTCARAATRATNLPCI